MLRIYYYKHCVLKLKIPESMVTAKVVTVNFLSKILKINKRSFSTAL